jgi:hypothetical protein
MPFAKNNPGGPGRPRKAEKFAGPIADAEKRIAQKLPELIDNMFLLAHGVLVEKTTLTGGKIIFKEPPDYKANEYLINRIMGKPTERQEHSAPAGGVVPVGFLALLDRVYGEQGDDSDTPTE